MRKLQSPEWNSVYRHIPEPMTWLSVVFQTGGVVSRCFYAHGEFYRFGFEDPLEEVVYWSYNPPSIPDSTVPGPRRKIRKALPLT